MQIFIAGCGRSGTSLTRSLMGCFRDTFIFRTEANFTQFAELSPPEQNVVVKRRWNTYQTIHQLPAEIGLIYCLRHPFDCLTSSHNQTIHQRSFHITPERWLAEYDALIHLREVQPQRAISYLRYEDLVSAPDAQQERLARAFGLVPRLKFSEDPENQVFTTSLRKWESKPEFRDYVYSQSFVFLSRVTAFCREFDYDLPA
jgi:hypothetical protein